MLSLIYYLFLGGIGILFMALSALVLVLAWPFDRARRCVHELSRLLVRIFFAIPPRWRISVEGLEYVDRSKSYVIVMNHQAMSDIPALYFVPLNFRWVSKREVFRIPLFGQFLYLHGDICIDRGHAAEAREKLLQDGCRWIGRGASVAIFPEGTRSKDGQVHRFKSGAFELARQAGVEILPVVLDGTTTVVRKNHLFNWRNRLSVRVLAPESPAAGPADLREWAEQVRVRMAAAHDEQVARRTNTNG